MKKFLLLVTITVALCLQLSAQNVGINVPVPTEALHVDSSIKIGKSLAIGSGTPDRKNRVKFGDGDYVTVGEEITDDKLYLRFGDLILKQSSGSLGNGFVGIGLDTATATLDVEGSLRFRTAAAAGRVLTSDANGNATWQTGAGFALPFSGSSAAGGTSFIVANTNGAANAIAGQSFGSGTGVTGFTSNGKGLYGSAGAGIGVDAFSSSGTAGVFTSQSGLAIKTVTGNVEINGKIKMIDGTQAAGRILTTDATGLASWQALPAGIPSIDFSGRRLTSQITVTNAGFGTTITGFDNISQAGGSNYNAATGVYTIPVTGFYQINASILWNPIPTNCTTYLSLLANGNTTIAQNYQPSSNAFGVSSALSAGRRFTAGETLTLVAYQNSGSSVNLFNAYDGQSFSVAFVHP
ncbi:MAG: hypothetical protein H7Y86_10910 [Rhizobacter sp.]|nr:hypothetical protein [Ferruginibacter sp.]